MKEAVNKKEAVVKNLLKALAILLILLGLAALGWWAKFQFDFVTYQDIKEGIVISYPRGWELQDHPHPDVIAIFVAPKTNALQTFRENFNIATADLSKNPLTIQQYAEIAIRQMTAVFQDTVVDERRYLKVAGHDAVKFVFHAKGNLETYLIVYAFIYRDIAYTFTYTGMSDQYLASKLKLEHMIKTVKLFF